MQGGMELSDRGLSHRIDVLETGLLFPPFSPTPKGGSRGLQGRRRASSWGFVSLRAKMSGAKASHVSGNRPFSESENDPELGGHKPRPEEALCRESGQRRSTRVWPESHLVGCCSGRIQSERVAEAATTVPALRCPTLAGACFGEEGIGLPFERAKT